MKKMICIAVLAATAALAEDKASAAAPADTKAAPAAADTKAAPAADSKSAEMKNQQWFAGNWTCKGTMHGATETKFATRVEFRLDLNGQWLQVKGTATTGPQKGKELFEGFAGWDGTQYQRYDFQPAGMTHLTSKGWDGDKIVFEGEGMKDGQKIALRHTVTKKGNNAYDGLMEVDGKPFMDQTCTRSGAKK